MVNSLVYPDTLPEQIAEWKNTIEEFTAKFEAMEQEVKTIADEMTQFYCLFPIAIGMSSTFHL